MYCQTADVIARAGRFGKAWSETSTPGYDDIELFIRARADEINAALEGRGIGVPLTGNSAGSLRSLNAAGALILLLGASALGSSADAVSTLYERVEKEWDAGLQMIRDGTHPAVTSANAGDSSDSGTADNFWDDEPEYGEPWWTDENDNPNIAPQFTRSEIF